MQAVSQVRSRVNIIQYQEVEEKIIKIHHQYAIVDSDVAALYGVETKRINEAVKNNTEKFPEGYLIALDKKEKAELVEKFDRFKKLKHSTTIPKAFTEKGLYMLATILKSPKATKTTLTIIDTFATVREIERSVKELAQLPEGSEKQKTLAHRTGELISDLLQPDELEKSESETSIELNFALVKFKYSVKKSK